MHWQTIRLIGQSKRTAEVAEVPDPLWQTSYHDHIIRNAESYWKIYDYIEQNPARWQQDMFVVV